MNRLTGLYQGTDTTSPLATWSYNIRGLPTARAEAGGSGMEWTWDPIERLASERHMFVPTTSNLLATFAYNPAGQIVTRTRNSDAYVWTGADRSDVYTVNGLNQYTAVDGVAHSYDANGNLTSDGVRTFKYDNENRLVSRTGAAGGTTTLRYDPLGRLHEVAGTQATTEFLWDGDALVSEYDNAGTLLRRYAHGGQEGIDDPLVWTEAGGGGTHRLLHSDHQGSIVAIAEPDGSTHAINRYDEWGVPAAGNVGRFGYAGQLWLPELGLWHYKARMYSPLHGRFMQIDPVGYEDQINLYAYVGNDPLNHVDADGREAASCYGPSLCGALAPAAPEEEQEARETVFWTTTSFVAGGALVRGGIWLGRTFLAWRAAQTFMRTASAAFRTAAAGGRHAGTLRQLAGLPTRQVQSALRSFDRVIAQHREKMAHPERFMTRESAADPAAVARARTDWQRTINRASEQRDIARDVLRARDMGCTGTRLCN